MRDLEFLERVKQINEEEGFNCNYFIVTDEVLNENNNGNNFIKAVANKVKSAIDKVYKETGMNYYKNL